MSKVAAIILAAGGSSRFRAAGAAQISKLVADLGGEPMVRWVARAALASQARPIVVVTGFAAQAIAQALVGLDLSFVANPDYAAGIAGSLRQGVAALPAANAGAIVMLGDMPLIPPPLLDRLIGAFAARPTALAAVPIHAGKRGNPVLLARALFPAIAKLHGDAGAKQILAHAAPGSIIEVAAEGAEIGLDIDTPDALEQARALMRPRGT